MQHDVAVAVLDDERLADLLGRELPVVALDLTSGQFLEHGGPVDDEECSRDGFGQHVPVAAVVVPEERLTAEPSISRSMKCPLVVKSDSTVNLQSSKLLDSANSW